MKTIWHWNTKNDCKSNNKEERLSHGLEPTIQAEINKISIRLVVWSVMVHWAV